MQKRGKTPPEAKAHYTDIVMRRDSSSGMVLGVLGYFFAFSMVWAIWWLAITAASGILAVLIVRSFDDDETYVIPADEVERRAAQYREACGYPAL
jgi:cytochrome o ubiquinol oxidase subunit I